MEVSQELLVSRSSVDSMKSLASPVSQPFSHSSPPLVSASSTKSSASSSSSSSASSASSTAALSPLSLQSTPNSSASSSLSLPATPSLLVMPPAPTLPSLASTCGAYLALPRPPTSLLLSAYVDYLHLESTFPSPLDYPSVVQQEFDVADRVVLCEYVQASCLRFGLGSETCVWAINLFDRFMSARSVKRPYLQLCAVSCLLLAWKMTEGGSGGSGGVSVAALSDWTAGLYSCAMIAEMELLVLANLCYRLSNLSAQSALSYLLEAFGPTLPGAVQHTTEHALTLSYASPSFICCRGSVLALAAVLAAWEMHDRHDEADAWLGAYIRSLGAAVDVQLVVRVAGQMVNIVQAVNERQMQGNDSEDEDEQPQQQGEDGEEEEGEEEDDRDEQDSDEDEADGDEAIGNRTTASSRDDLLPTDTDEAELDDHSTKRRRLT